jgi:hypothetical protein
MTDNSGGINGPTHDSPGSKSDWPRRAAARPELALHGGLDRGVASMISPANAGFPELRLRTT